MMRYINSHYITLYSVLCAVIVNMKAMLTEDDRSRGVAERLVNQFMRCSSTQRQQLFDALHQQLGTTITVLILPVRFLKVEG